MPHFEAIMTADGELTLTDTEAKKNQERDRVGTETPAQRALLCCLLWLFHGESCINANKRSSIALLCSITVPSVNLRAAC